MPRRLLRPCKRYGLWQVLCEAPRDPRGTRSFLCRCQCGVERTVAFTHLRRHESRSCGCQGKKAAEKAATVYRRHLAECALTAAERLLSISWPSTAEYARVLKQLAATRQLGVHSLIAGRQAHVRNPVLLPPRLPLIRQAIADAREELRAPVRFEEEGRLL